MRPFLGFANVLALGLTMSAEAQEKRDNKMPAHTIDILHKAQQFEVLSIDPNAKEKAKDGFHGYPILGRTTVKDGALRKQLVDAMLKGMEGRIDPARCFIPRHGIRATHDSKTVDLVICFECSQFHVEEGGKRTHLLINETPAPVLNKVLRDAGIPIAK